MDYEIEKESKRGVRVVVVVELIAGEIERENKGGIKRGFKIIHV